MPKIIKSVVNDGLNTFFMHRPRLRCWQSGKHIEYFNKLFYQMLKYNDYENL